MTLSAAIRSVSSPVAPDEPGRGWGSTEGNSSRPSARGAAIASVCFVCAVASVQGIPPTRVYSCECNYITANRVEFWRHDKGCDKRESSGHIRKDRAVVNFEHHTLARRLEIGDISALGTEAGWRMRVLLTWQRLVRAEKVQRQRRGSEIWQEAERRWHSRKVAGYTTTLQRHEDWAASDGKRKRGQAYDWHAQQDIMDASEGTTSGAAAVIARRLQRMEDSSQPGRKRTHTELARTQSTPGDASTPGAEARRRTRRHDGQLIFTPGALAQLSYKFEQAGRWHPAFGDG